MRYVILNNNICNDEIRSREAFLYHVFKVYFIPVKRYNYLELVSFPKKSLDIFMIFGHNNDVYYYLKNNNPYEKYIVLITCYQGIICIFKPENKKIFICNHLTKIRKGKYFGFHFNICDQELDLYNCNLISDPYSKIKNSFKEAD